MEELKHLFNPKEAGEYLDLSPKTLANSRSTGVGVSISYLKVGGSIKYRKSDLDAYLDKHTYNHTGETQGGSQWNTISTIDSYYLVIAIIGFWQIEIEVQIIRINTFPI